MDASYAAGGNPYAMAEAPGAYAGSGYNDMGFAGAPNGGALGSPGGQNPGYEALTPQVDNSYKMYTESPGGPSSDMPHIDPNTGIAPRTCTDCVCLPIFAVFLGVMIWAGCWGAANGDPNRLTHGMDYKGRLCGLDETSGTDKLPTATLGKYLFFCRNDATSSTPTLGSGALNLWEPICVQTCPTTVSANASLRCLQKQVITSQMGDLSTAETAPFGITKTLNVASSQAIVETYSYESKPFHGLVCLPTDYAAREDVMWGPLNPLVRAHTSLGSFENCWGILAWTTLFALVTGLLYLLIIPDFGKWILLGSLIGMTLVFIFIAFGGLWSIAVYFDESLGGSWYNNPLLSRDGSKEGTVVSSIVGVLALFFSVCCAAATIKVEKSWNTIQELVKIAEGCVRSMREVLLWPAIGAVFRFIMLYVLCKHLMYMATAGYVDDSRIVVNGVKYFGPSADFVFNYWTIPVVLFYLFGAIWILELCFAFGHFMLAYAVVLWYYSDKDEYGEKIVGADLRNLTLNGSILATRYHAGSIIYGALTVPITRYPRVFQHLRENANRKQRNAGSDRFENFVIGLASCLTGGCCRDDDKIENPNWEWTKNSFCDVVIRSSHWDNASKRAVKVLNIDHVKDYNGTTRIICNIGVLTLGLAGGAFTWLITTSFECYSNDMYDSYIQDPLLVSIMGFVISACIAYSYLSLIDQTVSVICFCFAWNSKYNKKLLEKYATDEMISIFGNPNREPDSYPMYGNAPNHMYLCSWMSTQAPAGPKGRSLQMPPSATMPEPISPGGPENSFAAGQLYSGVGPQVSRPGGYGPLGTQEMAPGASYR